MSLLDRGTEDVILFPEEIVQDKWGNKRTRPQEVGVPARAVIQPVGRSTEDQETGYLTSTRYRMRLVNYPQDLGAQAQIEWNGERWAIDGEPIRFNGSRRTQHVDYVIVRR
ncbi:hypothetical protein [Mycolicibacterium fortuitum]|uniref:hypothetical protein n=1 Tax=Mycolicibacterium fortuitum TaxID=1766 RepID=UPI003AAE7478